MDFVSRLVGSLQLFFLGGVFGQQCQIFFLEIICFEFPCLAGAHLAKIGGSFFPKIGAKSVAHFPKVGGSFSRSRSLIFDFLKLGGSFPQSRWLIFPKSVARFAQKLFACREQETRLGNLKSGIKP